MAKYHDLKKTKCGRKTCGERGKARKSASNTKEKAATAIFLESPLLLGKI